jgi:hypothetical protein
MESHKIRTIIGWTLVIVVVYVVLTNIEIIPTMKYVIQGESSTCIQIRGPTMVTDTVIDQLNISVDAFEVGEGIALLTIKNACNVSGHVNVQISCMGNGDVESQNIFISAFEKREIEFLGVPDCDLAYNIEPQLVTRRVNRTVYVNDTDCE